VAKGKEKGMAHSGIGATQVPNKQMPSTPLPADWQLAKREEEGKKEGKNWE
jgi:hypothetical protein